MSFREGWRRKGGREGLDGNETKTGVRSWAHPQEPLYSNFPWFNCMARSERENEREFRD